MTDREVSSEAYLYFHYVLLNLSRTARTISFTTEKSVCRFVLPSAAENGCWETKINGIHNTSLIIRLAFHL